MDMANRILLAGATGVVGRRLAPLLVAAGYEVHGTTRSEAKAALLLQAGVVPVVVDAFDADRLRRALVEIRPAAVIHQLTDLPPGLDPGRMAEFLPRNARIRAEGTRNLVAAALAAGARRLVAQSIAWAYAPAPGPWREDDPLDLAAEGPRGVTVAGVAALEDAVLGTPGLEGIVLRYGRLHGPGTGRDEPDEAMPLHVDDAAAAALLALARGRPGTYNVAATEGTLSTAKIRRELGWRPGQAFEAAPAA